MRKILNHHPIPLTQWYTHTCKSHQECKYTQYTENHDIGIDAWWGGVNHLSLHGLIVKVKSVALNKIAFCLFLSLSCSYAHTAVAQECENLSDNAEFSQLIQDMNAQVKAESYQEALKTAQRLIEICPTVPSVNYMAGKIYQKLDDIPMAHSYYRVATENTKHYAVDQDLMKAMWYARYETEFPEVIDFKAGRVTQLHQQALDAGKTRFDNEFQEQLSYAQTVMWTGAGVGIAGVVMAAVGAGVMADGHSKIAKIELGYDNIEDNRYNLTNADGLANYTAGSVLLGVGIGAAIAGAITTGIGGHKYTKLKTELKTQEELDVSLSVSYNHIGLNMTF